MEGEWSRVAVGRTAAQPPPPPTDVHVDSNNVLHWSPPNSTNGAPITEYIVERVLIRPSSVPVPENDGDQATSADCGWTMKRESAEVHSMSVAEGQPGCKYQLSVLAVSSGGTSVPSELNAVGMGAPAWATATTLAPPPSPPNLLCSEAGPNYLKLKWKPPGNASLSTATQYYYYLEKENDNG
ncbi:unnamed protein product, partial [Gongylonema pulchrum]